MRTTITSSGGLLSDVQASIIITVRRGAQRGCTLKRNLAERHPDDGSGPLLICTA